jgi:hypothetical protein
VKVVVVVAVVVKEEVDAVVEVSALEELIVVEV